MKNTNALTKVIAAILVITMTAVLFAGCNTSNAPVMSFVKDGKTYTITEDEYSLFLKVRKRLIFCNLLYTTSKDTASFWATESSEAGQTNEQYYMALTLEQVKSVLVEKYLFESLGLTLSDEILNSYKPTIKSMEQSYGGKGAYKQYFGYTASDYYNIYDNMVDKSEALLAYLCAEGGLLEVKDEDLASYYQDNFVGYQYIVIDLNNKVVLDEDGNRVVTTTKDSEGNEIDGDSYKTESLTDEEKETKQTLAESILAELAKEDAPTFEELINLYSDEYYSVEYSDGWFVDKEGTFIDSTVTEKVKDLEIGDYTKTVIESGNYQYIVKRVDLKEKVYEDTEENEYYEFFADFEEVVEYDKYENYVKSFFGDIVIAEEIITKYSLENTFLSADVDRYYQEILYYYYGISY